MLDVVLGSTSYDELELLRKLRPLLQGRHEAFSMIRLLASNASTLIQSVDYDECLLEF